MKLITAYELENRSLDTLTMIFHDFAKRLPRTEPDTIERAKVMASLQNISHAMARCA